MRTEAVLDLLDLLLNYTESTRLAVARGDNFEAATLLWRARRVMVETLPAFRRLAPNEAAAIFRNGESKTGEQPPLSSPGKHGPPDG